MPLLFADGADEAAVFAAATEATISGATVEAGDCTQITSPEPAHDSYRRNLLTTSEASLDFQVTVTGSDAVGATTDSVTTVVSAAVTQKATSGLPAATRQR